MRGDQLLGHKERTSGGPKQGICPLPHTPKKQSSWGGPSARQLRAHGGVDNGGLGGGGGAGGLGARGGSRHLDVSQILAVPGGHLEIREESGVLPWGSPSRVG